MKTKKITRQQRIKIVRTKENLLRVTFNELPDILKELTFRAAKEGCYGMQWQAHLYHVLRAAVERMNELVKSQPDNWRWLAEQNLYWPVLASLHPHEIKTTRDFLKTTLRLGKHVPLRLAPGRQLDNAATLKAVKLWNEVKEAREQPRQFVRHTGWRGKAQRLGEPVKANAPQWWTVAEMILKEKYPSPTLGRGVECSGLFGGMGEVATTPP